VTSLILRGIVAPVALCVSMVGSTGAAAAERRRRVFYGFMNGARGELLIHLLDAISLYIRSLISCSIYGAALLFPLSGCTYFS